MFERWLETLLWERRLPGFNFVSPADIELVRFKGLLQFSDDNQSFVYQSVGEMYDSNPLPLQRNNYNDDKLAETRLVFIGRNLPAQDDLLWSLIALACHRRPAESLFEPLITRGRPIRNVFRLKYVDADGEEVELAELGYLDIPKDRPKSERFAFWSIHARHGVRRLELELFDPTDGRRYLTDGSCIDEKLMQFTSSDGELFSLTRVETAEQPTDTVK
jgi:hypothetical protein